jgi:hypothetical protein
MVKCLENDVVMHHRSDSFGDFHAGKLVEAPLEALTVDAAEPLPRL